MACLECGKQEEWLCGNCLSKIKTVDEQLCPLCERAITPDGRICFACKKRSPLDGLLVCASYKEKTVSRAVHNFKYRFISDLSVPLGKIMTKKILSSSLPLPDFLLPVPLHSRRLRWRGFNQAELLAGIISKNLTPGMEIPIPQNVLVRRKYTSSQMKIKNLQQRKRNIENAFLVRDPRSIKGKTIFLIDDVATTGATLFECAKTLKTKGAREVFAIVIARQEMKVRDQ